MDHVLSPMKVAVATDGGSAAWAALLLLIKIATPRDVTVTVLSVVPEGLQRLEHAGEMLEPIAQRRARTNSAMKDAVRALHHAGFRAKGLLLEGRPDHEIAKAVRDHRYELVVVGSGSRSVVGHLVLGSVGTYVLDHSPCSVLLVHSVGTATPSRILLATDGTPQAEGVVGFVKRLMDPERCIVKAVSVVATDPIPVLVAPGAYVPLMNEHERHRLRLKAEHAVDSATEALSASGFSVSSAVADGPVEATLEAVGSQWSAALMVVGSRGLNIAQRVMLGSVGSTLARRTSATLVVREPSIAIAVDDQRTREQAFV